MTKLMTYHTVQASPEYFWENVEVATKLRANKLSTYAQYQAACDVAGCACYNEEVYNQHMEGVEF